MGVPEGVHRTNTLFYNPLLVLTPPQTLEELISLCILLKEQGIVPLALDNENGIIFAAEATLAASAGVDFYKHFYGGKLNLNDSRHLSALSVALDDFERLMAATDFESMITMNWTEATELFRNGNAAMLINGDWLKAYLVSLGAAPGIDFKVTAAPGTQELFSYTVDTFVLCQGASFRENGIEFLKVIGSREGQAAFGPLIGSTPIHTDVVTTGWDSVAIETYEHYRNLRILVSPEDPHYAISSLGMLFAYYVCGSHSKLQTIQMIRTAYTAAP